jgi:SAM-dependent methyltransferase
MGRRHQNLHSAVGDHLPAVGDFRELAIFRRGGAAYRSGQPSTAASPRGCHALASRPARTGAGGSRVRIMALRFLRWSRPAQAQPASFDVIDYWRTRYDAGGNSGKGSYGRLALFKAEVINRFIEQHSVSSVIELGCGDGNQFGLLAVKHYVGLDVSARAVEICRSTYAGRKDCEFHTTDAYPASKQANLVLSLDVIFHLVADPVYENYMRDVFSRSNKYVIIYSSNRDDLANEGDHVRHRKFSNWIDEHAPEWRLIGHVPNRFPRRPFLRQDRSFCDFYFYQRQS